MIVRNMRPYEVRVGNQKVAGGATIEVPESLGERLIEQPANWSAESTTSEEGEQ